MDWSRISEAVLKAQSLEPEARDIFLQTLDTEDPALAGKVSELIDQSHQLDGFMMTAVGDFLNETALYEAGDEIGGWKIEGLIGSGGMGDVYRASRADELYDQTVALKVMKGQNQRRKNRFNAERQRLAQLNHPDISNILDGGVTQHGEPYMVLEFIAGTPLLDFVRDASMDRDARLELFQTIAKAILYSHNHFVLHLDLKSENILIDAEHRLKVIDFGIATLLAETDDAVSAPYSLISASPEQLNGKPVSVQTDIFALGLLLHHLLTDTYPRRQPDGGVKLEGADLPADLQAILAKSLQTDPQERYPSLANLAEDIDAFRAHRPVGAYNGSGIYRFRKLVRRAPLASALASGLVVALAGGLGVSQYFASQARAEATRANQELARAEWALGNAETQTDVATKYADSLQIIFGQQENLDGMKNVLIDQWKTVVDNPDSTDDAKANISFAIGKHFAARLDFAQAQAILEPWLAAGYGNPELQRSGKAMLAETYLQVGNGRKAAQTVIEVTEMYKGTFAENSPGHVRDLMKASYYSHDRDIMEETKTVALRTLETDITPLERGMIWNQLMQMNLLMKDFESAHDAAEKVVEVGLVTPDYPITNVITDKDNLCQMKFFVKRDYESAQSCMSALERDEFAEIGDNNTGVNIYSVQALAAREAGDLERANKLTDSALTYDINPDKHHVAALAEAEVYAVMIKADLGLWDEADAIIARATRKKGGHNDQNIKLMQAYMELKRTGPQAAIDYLTAQSFSQRRTRYFFRMVYVMEEMEALGLDWSAVPAPPSRRRR